MTGVLRRQLTGEISFWPEILGLCYYWSRTFCDKPAHISRPPADRIERETVDASKYSRQLPRIDSLVASGDRTSHTGELPHMFDLAERQHYRLHNV